MLNILDMYKLSRSSGVGYRPGVRGTGVGYKSVVRGTGAGRKTAVRGTGAGRKTRFKGTGAGRNKRYIAQNTVKPVPKVLTSKVLKSNLWSKVRNNKARIALGLAAAGAAGAGVYGYNRMNSAKHAGDESIPLVRSTAWAIYNS